MRIAFGDLKIGGIARRYIQRALDKNWVSEGENVKEFEQKFAQKFGYKHAIATSSGTDAGTCACAALHDFGVERGDEVIVPACCYGSVPQSILAAGLMPKFVDIDLKTLNIDVSKIEAAISPKTRAINVIHNMGKPCEMDVISEIAKARNLFLIEDACESLGGKYKGREIGNIGDIGTCSFYAAHLIVCGEGGIAVTNRDDIANVINSLTRHGRPPGSLYFDFQRVGFNSKMNDMEAAIGLEGLENFDYTFEKRKKNLYQLLILTSDLSELCYFIEEEPYEVVSPHAFPLVLKNSKYNRERLYSYLESKGIQCKTLFGSLPTQHKAFQFLGYKYGDFPVAEYVGENGLHFGIHQYLTNDDLVYVSEVLQDYFRHV